jgi:hypothetical protein
MKSTICLFLFSFMIAALPAQVNINWSTPVDVAPSSFGKDYPRIVLGGNDEPVITWGRNNSIYFSKLEASGFTDPLKLNNDTTGAYVASWTGADIASRNDTIYACFMDEEWDEKTYIIRSFDNGESFSVPALIENYPDSASRFPSVTIDPAGNPLVAIMKMSHNEQDPHYVVRRSFDHGSTFTEEVNIGGWSGPNSMACDCCPASIKASGETVVVFYRDNLNNLRDIWATVSTDSGATFSEGFAVDDNQWVVFSCPSSGPDGVIIGDSLYSVFLSDGYCYLSKSSLSDGALASVIPLGELPQTSSQNFPRIDHYNNQVVISWRENSGGTKLYLSYTDDITAGTAFIQDTVYLSSVSSADLAIGEDGIHIALASSGDGTVKYIHGTFSTTSTENIYQNKVFVFPNPSSDFIKIKGHEFFESYNLYGANGQLILSGNATETIDISRLEVGNYVLELLDANEIGLNKVVVKN